MPQTGETSSTEWHEDKEDKEELDNTNNKNKFYGKKNHNMLLPMIIIIKALSHLFEIGFLSSTFLISPICSYIYIYIFYDDDFNNINKVRDMLRAIAWGSF